MTLLRSILGLRVSGALKQSSFKITSAGFRESAAEDADEILPAERLRHEIPALASFGVTGKRGFDQRRRIEFGFHDFGQKVDGLLDTAETGFFFLDAADEVVEVVAGGFGERVEESFEAVAAEGVDEERVEGSHSVV